MFSNCFVNCRTFLVSLGRAVLIKLFRHRNDAPARKWIAFPEQSRRSVLSDARLAAVAGSLSLWIVLLSGLVAESRAAVLQVTGATYSGAVTPGSPQNITGHAIFTGLTTSEGTFTSLRGATANAVVTSNL